MGCGFSRSRRRPGDGLERRKDADDDHPYPVTTPNSTKGLQQLLHDRGGHPINLKIKTQRERRKASSEAKSNVNTQTNNRQNNRRKNCEDEDDDDDDDGRRISSNINGVSSFMGSPSFREYCHPDSNSTGNREMEHGKER